MKNAVFWGLHGATSLKMAFFKKLSNTITVCDAVSRSDRLASNGMLNEALERV
jgi:hypothetical protein